jgi:hypothetical protein
MTPHSPVAPELSNESPEPSKISDLRATLIPESEARFRTIAGSSRFARRIFSRFERPNGPIARRMGAAGANPTFSGSYISVILCNQTETVAFLH